MTVQDNVEPEESASGSVDRRETFATLVAAVLFFAVGVIALVATSNLPFYTRYGPGPRFFLVFIASGTSLLGLVLLADQAMLLRSRPAASVVPPQPSAGAPGQGSFWRLLVLIAAIAGFANTLEQIGFQIATLLLASIAFITLGVRPLRAVLGALAFTVVLHLAFIVLLRVQLPVGPLGWRG